MSSCEPVSASALHFGNIAMRGSGSAARAPTFDAALVGRSDSVNRLRQRLKRVADVERTTLILGPTGSGKEVIARTLHGCSQRWKQPFVTVHCGAMPDSLAESELFGHRRGAFTGATEVRTGLVRSAQGGTLFLDEVNSLSLPIQAKLLRFLESGEYRAVGADHVEQSDAWVIAASNQDLRESVDSGSFRPDLLYRLEVVRVDVPPLHERSDDVLLLAQHFLEQIVGDQKRFSDSARRTMLKYSWPGNVRELKHRVESAALLADGEWIAPESLGLDMLVDDGDGPVVETDAPTLDGHLWQLIEDNGLTLSQAMDLCEKLLIQRALAAEHDNRTRAASRLGVHVRTIFKKLAN
jgi:DNA-binding NtrC family response regulator